MRNEETVLHPLSLQWPVHKVFWMMLPATFLTSPLYEWYFFLSDAFAKQLQVMHDTLHLFVIDI